MSLILTLSNSFDTHSQQLVRYSLSVRLSDLYPLPAWVRRQLQMPRQIRQLLDLERQYRRFRDMVFTGGDGSLPVTGTE